MRFRTITRPPITVFYCSLSKAFQQLFMPLYMSQTVDIDHGKSIGEIYIVDNIRNFAICCTLQYFVRYVVKRSPVLPLYHQFQTVKTLQSTFLVCSVYNAPAQRALIYFACNVILRYLREYKLKTTHFLPSCRLRNVSPFLTFNIHPVRFFLIINI